MRAIRVREGQRREHDMLNDAIFEKDKAWATKEKFNKALDEYYTARGWDVATGIPRRSTLEKLGLKDVADDLEKKYGVKVPA
jgi:aldehyde:ferredoxin oxidoreductase